MNPQLAEAVKAFLNQSRLAVVGYSWEGDDPATHIVPKLLALGYDVVPVSLTKETIAQQPTVRSLGDIPSDVGGVLVTGDEHLSAQVVEVCAQKQIPLVWLHCMLGTSPKRWMRKVEHAVSSVGPNAIRLARERGVTLIPGGCPMMFCREADLPHRAIRTMLDWMGCFETRPE
jgi:predicted CoA-binding protein